MIILLNLSQIILKIINQFLESLVFAQEIPPFIDQPHCRNTTYSMFFSQTIALTLCRQRTEATAYHFAC